MIIALKFLIGTFFGLMFLLMAFQTRKVKSPVKMIAYILLELVLTIILITGSFLLVSYNLKKAVMTNVKNIRLLSREELAITGYVQNVGKYTIDNAYLKIKLINAVSGKTKDVLRNRDGTKKDNTYITKRVIAKNLRIGEQRKFTVTIKYPPYFRLADIRTTLSWDDQLF